MLPESGGSRHRVFAEPPAERDGNRKRGAGRENHVGEIVRPDDNAACRHEHAPAALGVYNGAGYGEIPNAGPDREQHPRHRGGE